MRKAHAASLLMLRHGSRTFKSHNTTAVIKYKLSPKHKMYWIKHYKNKYFYLIILQSPNGMLCNRH